MSIESMNIEQTNKKEIKQQKDIFSNSEKQFSKLKNEENISKEFYLNQIKEFENKTGEHGKQILNNLQSFLTKNNIDDVKGEIATMIFVEILIEKKGNKTDKIVKLLETKKPALFIKFIDNFVDDVIKLEKKTDNIEKKTDNIEKKTDNIEKKTDNIEKKTDNIEKKTDNIEKKTDNIEKKTDNIEKKTDKIIKDKLNYQGVKNINKKLNENIKIIEDTLVYTYHFKKEKAYEFAKKGIISIKKNEDINKIMGEIEKKIFSIEAQKLKQQVDTIKDDKLRKEVKQQIQIKESKFIQAGLDPDKAYLAAFAEIYRTDESLQQSISLAEEDKAVLANVETEVKNLGLEKLVGGKEISGEIIDFANSKTEYDGKIKKSLDISGIEDMKVSLDQQKQLSKKYPKLINKMFQQVVSQNKGIDEKQLEADYSKYLNGEKTKEDKIFSVVGKKLLEYEVKQSTEGFVQEYKQLAMKEYTKSIFSMFDKAVGTENITKNFGKTDEFDIKENGQVNLNFNYKNTPLDFKISADGNISMTDYVGRDGVDKNSGAFQKKETKLNDFFTIVSIKDLLQPEKINFKDLVKEKDIKLSLQNQIQEQVQDKLQKNNALGNQELMKTETNYEMERQSITYKMLSLYQPPQKVQNYLTGNNEKIFEQDRGLFSFLGRIDKTLRTNEQAQNVLEATLADEKFTSIFKKLQHNENIKTGKENTYDVFKKLGFMGANGELNIRNIQKIKINIDKVSTNNDIKNLPEVEGYDWEYENGKLKLKEKKEESDLFASLDQKFPNTKKIEI